MAKKGLLSAWKNFGSGWFQEPRRHALAAKGIKTGRKTELGGLSDIGFGLAGAPIKALGDVNFSKKTLTVVKKAHHRKGYIKDVKPGPGVVLKRIKSTEVKRSKKFKIKDIGTVGRGKKVIGKLRKGKMTDVAVKLGYIQKGQRVSDISSSKFDDFSRDLAKKVGPKRAFRMLLAQKVFRKRLPDNFKSKVDIGLKAISSKYPKQLKPTEAIQARLRMGKYPGPG